MIPPTLQSCKTGVLLPTATEADCNDAITPCMHLKAFSHASIPLLTLSFNEGTRSMRGVKQSYQIRHINICAAALL